MKLDEFLRVYSLRSPNIMWFLGAGASAAAGIKTAYDIIWDCKRAIYCTQMRVAVNSCPALNDPGFRSKIQQYFNSTGKCPVKDAPEEYTYYFEAAYPSEQDRRRYLEKLVSAGTPSFGHMALATLLRADKTRIVWTTNFDRMIEDAVTPLFGSSGKIVVASLGEPNVAVCRQQFRSRTHGKTLQPTME